MNMKYSLYAVLTGVVLDLILGDPHTPWHPACIIGKYISFFENHFRKLFPKSNEGELVAGGAMVVAVLLVATGIPTLMLVAAYHVHAYFGLVVEAIMCYAVIATKSLKDESMQVYEALKKEGLESGRTAVSMIVGRDTKRLDEKGVIKATIETIAENFSDGVVAPLFYMMLGGAAAGYFYKAVNTMDSMVGYKNERYLYFGRVAAHLDDIANYIPARLSAFCMIGASYMMRCNGTNAVKIFLRDRNKHASPNSAQTEAVAAGALEVMLAGDAWYFGELYHKQTIGDDIRPVEVEDIVRMNRLMYCSTIISVLVMAFIKAMMI